MQTHFTYALRNCEPRPSLKISRWPAFGVSSSKAIMTTLGGNAADKS